MNIIDLQKPAKDLPEFEPIAVREYETSDEARNELDRAERAYTRYRKMLEHIKAADAITDDLHLSSPEYDLMSEEDHNDALEHGTIDILSIARKHIEAQAAKMKQYCDDLEATAEDIEAEERDTAKYGSYADQVRSHYYSTR
jgi:hypothetical protein